MPKLDDEQLTLGDMIAQLKAIPRPHEVFVFFEFAELYVTGINSYRGYYEDLALSFTTSRGGVYGKKSYTNVVELLELLEESVGRDFEGWKGGTYTAHPNKALWAACPGCTGGTAIVGVHYEAGGWKALIKTKHID